MFPLIGSLIGGAASFLGSIFQNSAQQASADKAMAFQAQQTDTAHQREVADLKAAGLNPILSAGGLGAASAQGIQANVGNPGAAAMAGATSGANTAQMASMMQSQLDNLQADTQLKGDSAAAAKASAASSLAQAHLAMENSATTAALRQSQVERSMWDAGVSANEFGAGLGSTAKGKLEKSYLESVPGSILTQLGRGGGDIGKMLSGGSSALGLALLK